MRKRLWIASCVAAICVGAANLAAQAPGTTAQSPSAPATSAPANPTQGTSTPTTASKALTISGCIERQPEAALSVSKESAAMPFTLTGAAAVGAASAGSPPLAKTYRLDGTESVISPHVGHKVELTGVVIDRPGATATAGASAPRFKVDSLKMVAPTCS